MRLAIVGVDLVDYSYHLETRIEIDVHVVIIYYVQNQEILE